MSGGLYAHPIGFGGQIAKLVVFTCCTTVSEIHSVSKIESGLGIVGIVTQPFGLGVDHEDHSLNCLYSCIVPLLVQLSNYHMPIIQCNAHQTV